MTAFLLVMMLDWTPTNSRRDPNVVLEGNWQSCRGEDGEYEEREYVRREGRREVWTLHMGPQDEFALYRGGATDEHIEHTDPRNLFGPKFRISDIPTARGRRAWAKLGYWFSIVQAGGSRSECESFYVVVLKGTR